MSDFVEPITPRVMWPILVQLIAITYQHDELFSQKIQVAALGEKINSRSKKIIELVQTPIIISGPSLFSAHDILVPIKVTF